ncbi:hypothetical protein BGZ73_002212 [Actinomortierella ambigua]|nr:hypothetical protein BGZ73_002212 [Actinomortierella ambigua]
MRFTISVAALVAMAGVISAQDANCTAVVNDFVPSNPNGKYQKCYADQAYNRELVAGGPNPNYKDIVTKVCSSSPCSASTLKSATDTYLKACNASISIETEASGYQILQLGKNALKVFFAEPIRNIYCGHDPKAVIPPPPAPQDPVYCLATEVANPSMRFQTQLSLYLTEGTLRANQGVFYTGLAQEDVCSPCSQQAVNTTVNHLSNNLMPGIAFYTPEFVQYWTKFVPEYNKYCKSSIPTTVWPEGTLNQTMPNLPPPSTTVPSNPVAPSASTPTPTKAPSSGMVVRPSTAGLLAVVAAVAAYL